MKTLSTHLSAAAVRLLGLALGLGLAWQVTAGAPALLASLSPTSHHALGAMADAIPAIAAELVFLIQP